MRIQDLQANEFKSLLYKTADMIFDLYTNIDSKRVYHSKGQDEVRRLFNEDLPQKPVSIDLLLSKIKEDVIKNVALHFSPHFYAWVTSNATQASLLGDMLANALNVNATTWMNAASASEMEQQVVKWIGQFVQYAPDSSGVLLSGGSMANLTGLKVCIAQRSPYDFSRHGMDRSRPLVFYCSGQTHFCIDRAVSTLGIGTDNLRKIRTNSDFTIDTLALKQQIELDLKSGCVPICIIGNAGTVNTGAVDPIDDLASLCQEYGLWLHLDAAYGGFAASTDMRGTRFRGLESADSVAIDLHKWLFVPFECGCLLVKQGRHLKDSFSLIPDYQRFEEEGNRLDYSEYSLQQSRSFKALKVWMNFKAYGAESLRDSIQNSMDLMQYLGDLINEADDFELMAAPSLSVICFRYTAGFANPSETRLNRLNKEIVKRTETDGRVFIRETTLKGAIAIRVCCTNFRRNKKHIEYLLNVIRTIGGEIADTALDKTVRRTKN